MNGTVSQIVTLTSAANGVISGKFNPDSFFPAHSDFKYCDSVLFADIGKDKSGKIREQIRYSDPNHWLQHLAADGGSQVWLTFVSQTGSVGQAHQLAAFVGGGGIWQLVVAMKDTIEFWVSRWDVVNQNAPDKRIWRVTYNCLRKSVGHIQPPQPDLGAASSQLINALANIREFAGKHHLTDWEDWFLRASTCLEESQPVSFPDYIDFVCLDSYPEISRRLFAAAYQGWVFGGMGSWNDLFFEPEAENTLYHELSASLYAAITDAIQQATWSFKMSDTV